MFSPIMKSKLKLILVLILLAILAGLFFLIKNKTGETQSDKIKITASFYPYYFFASQIGGEKAEVSNITPAGTEPHDYELTTGDIIKINSSQLFIMNGLVEGWKDKIKANSQESVKIITAGDGLFTQDFMDEEGKKSPDPHIWLNITLAKKQVNKILDATIDVDPSNKNYYQSNAKKLIGKLDELDRKYKNGLKLCKKKDIVTSHSAFGYLASEYELNQVSIAGLSPDEEPSLRELSEVSDFVKENNIKYIFFESLVSPKFAETIAKETGAQSLVLNPLEGLTPAEEAEGKNYLTIMEENLHNLKVALECN